MRSIIIAIVSFAIALAAAVQEFAESIVDGLQTEIAEVDTDVFPKKEMHISLPSTGIVRNPMGAPRGLNPSIEAASKQRN